MTVVLRFQYNMRINRQRSINVLVTKTKLARAFVKVLMYGLADTIDVENVYNDVQLGKDIQLIRQHSTFLLLSSIDKTRFRNDCVQWTLISAHSLARSIV